MYEEFSHCFGWIYAAKVDGGGAHRFGWCLKSSAFEWL